MKVAIDSGPLTSGHSVRGVGVHTKLLVEHLKKIRNLEIDVVDFTKTDLSKYDLAHYQFFNPFFVSLPFTKKCKTVITIHDLTPLLYPKHYPPGIKGRINFLINKMLIRNTDAIITISETSKKDIVRFLDVDPDKIHVVYLAPKKIFKKITDKKILNRVKTKYKLPDKFVLYVGDINYNKNIPGLLEACQKINIPLVLVGKQAGEIENLNLNHPELAHLKQLFGKFKNNKNITRLGFVPDEDLVSIYNSASVYCQPSFYEGFGIPMLEGMACGTPVVAARTQALVEIGGDAAIFADPKSPSQLAGKIKKVLSDSKLSKLLSEEGTKNASRFSWEKTALKTFEVYKQVAR